MGSIATQSSSNGGGLSQSQADARYRAKSAYVHSQGVSSATWNVAHGQNSFPVVLVKDSAGTQIEGDVTYVDLNNLTISFSTAFSGTAYLA